MSGGSRRIVVTGAGGRLGRALIDAIQQDPDSAPLAWRRPEYDLDSTDPARLLARDAPQLVIHAAAWTDVDGCARDPELATRRNSDAVGSLARACAANGAGLVLVSTNEVFDGTREDGSGYVEDDPTAPVNPYGASKLGGERAAAEAFSGADGLWIVRTAWLYGPPGADFPAKIVAASDRHGGDPLPVVADETGSPTYTVDLARAIMELTAATSGGTYHLVNSGSATRFAWAAAVLAICRPGRTMRPISRLDFQRASVPPPWGVLDTNRAASAGIRMRAWREALRDHLGEGC